MKKITVGPKVAIFVLFFGLSLLEAVRDRDYIKGGLWFLLGLVFLFADNKQ